VVHNLVEVLVRLLLDILPLALAVHLATYFLVHGGRDVTPHCLYSRVAWVSTGDVLAHLHVVAEREGLVAEGAEPLVIEGGGRELSGEGNVRLEHNCSELGEVARGGIFVGLWKLVFEEHGQSS
jgi:hypothetical protein